MRQNHEHRYRQGPQYQNARKLENRLSIKERPKEIENRTVPAHWEGGTNENTNELIRQFFPKGTDFNKISRREIKKVQYLLNDRPRATLNFNKPFEVLDQLLDRQVLR